MGNNVYVGNLSWDTNQAKLQELAEAHGQVTSVNVITDRDTGRPRGFAFVEMATDVGAVALINGLNGQTVDGRELKAAEAKPRRSGGGDRGGGRSGGYHRRW
jgi:RNA recognition motif-containing protein